MQVAIIKRMGFIIQTDKGITAKSIEADQSYIKNTDSTPQVKENKIRFKNPILNFLLGPWSTEYTIYIPEDSFIQENYIIDALKERLYFFIKILYNIYRK